ncbi:X-Pro aminopeptidase, partial [Photobacterium aphoticum]|uniref:aminopeptidase family protein P n=1 Tax=Photobacterium aphoticum TaxID=754436 RepID=UPI000D4FB7A5
VRVHAPEALEAALLQLGGKAVLVDPATSNAWASQVLRAANATLIDAADPCLLPKAAKNATEIAGMKACHIRDGVAVSKFLAWVDRQVAQGNLLDEGTLSDQLWQFRAQDSSCTDVSFDTISAAGANAAMCHYNHLNQPAPSVLEMDNVYLVDSGGQYPDGTTDITRTIAVGTPNDEVKQTFTLVLKGHIGLASARFPKGTTGSQLDALARQHLWAYGFDYDHGTGHGVGHFLSVHEGPQRIAKVYNPTALLPGMVLSNEPGYYRADAFGIRIENLELVVEIETAGDMHVLGFESLTRAPIDRRLVDISLMTDSELAWLNRYHETVFAAISPALEGDDLAWLEQATAPLSR